MTSENGRPEWVDDARICHEPGGLPLAAEESGLVDVDAEPEIVAAIRPEAFFVDDMDRLARETAERLRVDHAHFRADHALDDLTTVDHVFR